MTRYTRILVIVTLGLGSLTCQVCAATPTTGAPAAGKTAGSPLSSAPPNPPPAAPSASTTTSTPHPDHPAAASAATVAGTSGSSAGAATGPSQRRTPRSLEGQWLALYWFGVALLAAIVIFLAYRTPLLRDRGEKPDSKLADKPWSLGRTQMAWWFFFVVAAFVYIFLVTGSHESLSTSVLALIGISAGTALAGAVIDDTKQTQMAQKPLLEDEQKDLQDANKHLTAAVASGGNVPVLQANLSRLRDIAVQLEQIPQPQKSKKSFWTDILSDENGISFHRFQMVIWTLVLTLIFVVQVATDQTMPDFNAQLLGLMGISSGTYIGFKFPEKLA